MIKNLALILSIIFIILTFIGAGYVLFNDGKVNAGYACVPMIFALISIFIESTNDGQIPVLLILLLKMQGYSISCVPDV